MHRRLLELAGRRRSSFVVVVAADDVEDALVLADGVGYELSEQEPHPRGVLLTFRHLP